VKAWAGLYPTAMLEIKARDSMSELIFLKGLWIKIREIYRLCYFELLRVYL
jgi:hypothetical protein